MAKYNYDKKALKGLGVGPFLNEVKTREEHIENAPANEIKSVFNANIVSKRLHPDNQLVKIAKVDEVPDGKLFTLVPDKEKGCNELAYFRSGQYVNVPVQMAELSVSRPYTICSSPKDALGENGFYTLCIKKAPNGFASAYALENWKEGTELVISGPLGHFYYQQLRDAKKVVSVAGGSGITPFASMAKAIAEGTEDFDLIIIYGSKTKDQIILKDYLKGLEDKSNGRVKVVHVLSDEEAEGYEHGFITSDIIKKYAGDGDYSLYACGPKVMYNFLYGEVEKLGLTKRRARFEVPGEYGMPNRTKAYPEGFIDKEFTLTILVRGTETKITMKATETLISACERAGLHVTTDCRSGICGWCHSRLVSGDVFIPSEVDGRRAADKKFGWIHPCATFPLSDVTIEVFPNY